MPEPPGLSEARCVVCVHQELASWPVCGPALPTVVEEHVALGLPPTAERLGQLGVQRHAPHRAVLAADKLALLKLGAQIDAAAGEVDPLPLPAEQLAAAEAR